MSAKPFQQVRNPSFGFEEEQSQPFFFEAVGQKPSRLEFELSFFQSRQGQFENRPHFAEGHSAINPYLPQPNSNPRDESPPLQQFREIDSQQSASDSKSMFRGLAFAEEQAKLHPTQENLINVENSDDVFLYPGKQFSKHHHIVQKNSTYNQQEKENDPNLQNGARMINPGQTHAFTSVNAFKQTDFDPQNESSLKKNPASYCDFENSSLVRSLPFGAQTL